MRINIVSIIVVLFTMAILLPSVSVLGGEARIPLVTFMVPVFLLYIFSRPFNLKLFPALVFWLLILFSVLVSTIWGSITTDIVSIGEISLYLVKFSVFMFFAHIAFSGNLHASIILRMLVLYLTVSVFVAIFQWLGVNSLNELYSLSEDQYLLTQYDISFRRVPSTAHMITAVGGLSIFSFVSGVVFLTFGRSKVGLVLIIGGVLLAIFSQSRTAFVLIPICLILYLFCPVGYDKKVKLRQSIVRCGIIFLSPLLALIVFYLFSEFILYQVGRFELFGEQAAEGGNRVGQVYWVIHKVSESVDNFLIGITNTGRSAYGNIFVEVEPANIFLMYGVLGFFSHYVFIVFFIVFMVFSIKRYYEFLDSDERIALVITCFSVVVYQIYSLSYFFFRDVYATYMMFSMMGFSFGLLARFAGGKNAVNTQEVAVRG